MNEEGIIVAARPILVLTCFYNNKNRVYSIKSISLQTFYFYFLQATARMP